MLRRQVLCCLAAIGAAAAVSAVVFTADDLVLIMIASWATPITGAVIVAISERGLNALYSDYGVPRH